MRKIIHQGNEKEKVDNAAVCFEYVIRLHWGENGQVSPFPLAGGGGRRQIYACSYININTAEIRRLNWCRISVG